MPERPPRPVLVGQLQSVMLLATALNTSSARKQGRRDARVLERRAIDAANWGRPRLESGLAAWLGLRELETELERRAFAIAQEVSSAEWLFFLRRCPRLFSGYEVLGSGYLTSIAESISALSMKPSRTSEAALPRVAYSIEPSLIGSLHRIGGASYLLGNLQNVLRCAGKGSVIKSRITAFPVPLPDPELDAMTALWDERMRASGFDFLAQAGQYSHKLHDVPEPTDIDVVPLTNRSNTGRFSLSPFPIGSIPTLTDPKLPADLRFPTEALDLIVFLVSSSLFRLVEDDDTRSQIEQFEQTGLRFVLRHQALEELGLTLDLIRSHRFGTCIPAELDLGTPEQILGRIIDHEVRVWPPSMGPAVREAADGLLVEDLWAATHRLQRALARPAEMAGGRHANEWSAHFEAVIQDAIDATAWKPSPAVATLRGRHLRIGGRRIGEIDAIGELAHRLLVVSCKCIPFSEEWVRGEYNAVRNVASAIDEAVTNWSGLLNKLRATPEGDNYELSGFTDLVGVVVLPSLPWTPTAESVAEVAPGLRAAVNAYELDRWITAGS
jgi:hypothetical protein